MSKWNPGATVVSRRPVTDTPLKTWMEREGVLVTKLADEMGMKWKTLENWMHGRNLPPVVWCFKIELFTKGAVPASSWLVTDLGKAQWQVEGSDATR